MYAVSATEQSRAVYESFAISEQSIRTWRQITLLLLIPIDKQIHYPERSNKMDIILFGSRLTDYKEDDILRQVWL